MTEKFDIFVSYDSKDTKLAEKLVTELRNLGLKVWWKKPSESYRSIASETRAALDDSMFFVPLFSKNSINSDSVNFLLGAAMQAGKKIVPVVSKDVVVPKDDSKDLLPATIRTRVEKRLQLTQQPFAIEDPKDVAVALKHRVDTRSD